MSEQFPSTSGQNVSRARVRFPGRCLGYPSHHVTANQQRHGLSEYGPGELKLWPSNSHRKDTSSRSSLLIIVSSFDKTDTEPLASPPATHATGLWATSSKHSIDCTHSFRTPLSSFCGLKQGQVSHACPVLDRCRRTGRRVQAIGRQSNDCSQHSTSLTHTDTLHLHTSSFL